MKCKRNQGSKHGRVCRSSNARHRGDKGMKDKEGLRGDI